MGRWSRGMIPRLQRGDQEFESPPAHFLNLYLIFVSLKKADKSFENLIKSLWAGGLGV